MISISRPAAARFRAVARRCIIGRPRGPSPPVIIEQTRDAITMFSNFGKVALALAQPGGGAPVKFAIPGSLLDEISSSRGGTVQVGLHSDQGCCSWDNRESTWQPITLSDEEGPWPMPPSMKPVNASLLSALHECGRSAARDSVRFAMSKIQLQGKAGNVAGTNGRQMLRWNSFRFPFSDSVLLPAVPVFGCQELCAEEEIRLGKTERHLVVTAGPWMIWLTLDKEGRFPDVASIIPRSPTSELHLDDLDRQKALAFIDGAVKEDDAASVTIDLADLPALRIKVDSEGRSAELSLDRSQRAGDPVTFVVNRDHLARALTLGLNRLSTPSENGPVMFHDDHRTYVITAFVPTRAIPASRTKLSPAPRLRSRAMVPVSQGDPDMPSETNGRDSHETAAADAVDFMAEAEGLRDAIAEVGRRAARLVNTLKQLQKQRRVLETAWSSLKNLRLGS